MNTTTAKRKAEGASTSTMSIEGEKSIPFPTPGDAKTQAMYVTSCPYPLPI
jgi:hypothetical protein